MISETRSLFYGTAVSISTPPERQRGGVDSILDEVLLMISVSDNGRR